MAMNGQGMDVHNAIDWVKQQTQQQFSSRSLERENVQPLQEDLMRLEKMKQNPPNIA
jgi:hypothetical protein